MKKEPLFSYNPESGEASCLIEGKDGNIIYGIAKCHPDDMDMANEKTGCNYAYKRAYIKVLQAYKKEDYFSSLIEELNYVQPIF